MMRPGHSIARLKTPTSPKNSGMLTLPSSPIRFFIKIVYIPYRIALKKANESPNAICFVDLWGKEPRFLSLDPERSTLEISIIPDIEASTPMSFLRLKASTFTTAPIRRVHILLVDVKIVVLATVVYCKQATVK